MGDNLTNEEYVPVCRKKPLKLDQHSEYRRTIENLRDAPQSINCYKEVFCKILRHYAEIQGELLISDDGKEVCFARDGKPLTDFGAIPLSIIRRFSGDGTQDYVELLILGKNVPPKIITICARELSSAQWIENLGIDYIYAKQEIWTIKILIQGMAKFAPVREEFLYSGWASEGQNFYVMNGQKIYGDDGHEEFEKRICKHTLQMLNVAPHSLTIALLSIEILSLVQSKMLSRGIYFKGVCCIVAQTQSFKTTLASLFFDVLNGRRADINFEASIAAIIRTIGNSRDSTVVLDDYKPGATKSECRDMLQKINTIIRLCSDDSGGIKRAGAKNEIFTNIARCLVVVTAEHIHFDVQSTLARLLIFEMDGKSVNKDKLTYFQENHDKYRECIENFIKYIISQGVDAFCEKLEQRFLQERNALRTELFMQYVPVDNRTSDMCAWLYIAFSEFLKYVSSIKAISEKKVEEYVEESKRIFLSIMKQQAERVGELDEVRRFFSGLRILIETREVHIGELQSRNANYATADSKSAIGFRKNGFYYLKNDVAFQKVDSYFKRNGREFAIREGDLRKKLADRGYINRKNDKTYIHRLFINHESYQCVQFNESKFKELLKGGAGNESEEGEIPSDRVLQQNANAFLGR